MLDPFVVAIAVGLLGSAVAGPAVVHGLQALPPQRRKTAEWLLIAGAALLAILADFLLRSPIGGGFVYALAILPGLVAYLAFRTLLASALVSLAPLYFAIGDMTRRWPTYTPEVALDRAVPLQPAWVIVYGSLYVVVLLPLLVVRHRALWRRAMQAYLLVMVVSYAGFLLFPTLAPRPDDVVRDGFAAWALRLVYAIDPPHGCFPSLHVAYAFVSALTCFRVDRGVGVAASLWAALIAVSTLYTKQHYVVDVIAGGLAAYGAYLLFLRGHPREEIAEDDRRLAPRRALVAVALFGIMVAGFWVAYVLGRS